MKIDDLLCFQAIARYRSFSNAAESLYISQSSLSKKIKSLESQLGGTLFLRKCNNAVSLSPFGEYVATHINNIIQDYDLLIESAENYSLNNMRKVQIATFLNVAHSGLMNPIISFESTEPNFYIETTENNHSHLASLMSMNEIDICLAYYELVRDMPNYDVIHLKKDPLVLICSREYAKKNGITEPFALSEARNFDFCFPREDMELFAFLINTCKTAGFIPRLTHSNVRLGTIRKYISVGMRCTLQLESISHSKFYGDEFFIVRLENNPALSMCLYINKSTHKQKLKNGIVESIKSYIIAL